MASNDRDRFIQAMVSSIAKKQDIEKQLLEVPTNDLSSSALAQLDDIALDAADSLTYDFPSPSINGVESLIKAIMFCTGQNPRESLFIRTFSISPRFIDGIVYCCSRHSAKKEKGSVEESGALPSSLSSELAAVVFIKCVRFLLEAPLHIVARMLDSLVPPPIDETGTDLDIEERVEKMTEKMAGAGAVVEEERASEEEVWASELDDDDVSYEGMCASPEPDKSIRGFDGGYGGHGYVKVLTAEDCQKRLGCLITRFSSNFLSGISAESWKKYGLVSDICCIVQHLRPTENSSANSLLLQNPKLEDGTTLTCLPHWVEEGWVEYTYALRDNVICSAFDVSALNFLLTQLDRVEEEGVMSPCRCINLVVLHTVVRSQFNLPLSALRKGLLERLEVFSECIGSVTDSLTTIAAAGTKAQVDAQVEVERVAEVQGVLSEEGNKALLYEQAKVLLVLVGFAVGVSLSSETVTEAKVLTALPPSSTLIRSQVFRNVLKLVCVLGVKPSFKQDPNPHVLGMQLLVILTSHSSELSDFAIRAPMTTTLTENDTALSALLTLALATTPSQDSQLGSTIHELAENKCRCILDQSESSEKEGVTSLLAAVSHWNVLAIRRLQTYLNGRGAWFRDWLLSAQRMITEKRVLPTPSPTNEDSGGASVGVGAYCGGGGGGADGSGADVSGGASAEAVASKEDPNEDPKDDAKEEGIKGPEKRRLVRRADALKGAKLLLEKSAGDNKTD